MNRNHPLPNDILVKMTGCTISPQHFWKMKQSLAVLEFMMSAHSFPSIDNAGTSATCVRGPALDGCK